MVVRGDFFGGYNFFHFEIFWCKNFECSTIYFSSAVPLDAYFYAQGPRQER